MTRYYFDHNATTPVSQEVLEAFLPVLREEHGNASSIHREGQEARHRLDAARAQIAALAGCGRKEIVFVSGGTEAGNLAVFGIGRRNVSRPRHVVTSQIEHPAVLAACARLEQEGVAVTYVAPGADGVVNAEDVRAAIRPETVLVSVMHVNNETGAIQPVREIAKAAHDHGAVTHSDGVQALGRIPVNVSDLGVDLYSMSGHKLYAPKGIGALYVRSGLSLEPLIYGGRHEQGRRAGTENVAGAVALGAAAEWVRSNGREEFDRVEALRDRLERQVLERLPDVSVNAAGAPRAPNTANFCVEGVEGEAMVIALDLRGFAISSGSACSSGAVEPSHVLLAMGMSRERARSSIRVSLGRGNDEAQVDALAEAIAASASHLRRLSTAYA